MSQGTHFILWMKKEKNIQNLDIFRLMPAKYIERVHSLNAKIVRFMYLNILSEKKLIYSNFKYYMTLNLEAKSNGRQSSKECSSVD